MPIFEGEKDYTIEEVQGVIGDEHKIIPSSEYNLRVKLSDMTEKAVEDAKNGARGTVLAELKEQLKDTGIEFKDGDPLHLSIKTHLNNDTSSQRIQLLEQNVTKAENKYKELLQRQKVNSKKAAIDSVISGLKIREDISKTVIDGFIGSIRGELMGDTYSFEKAGDKYHILKDGKPLQDDSYNNISLSSYLTPKLEGVIKKDEGGAGSQNNGGKGDGNNGPSSGGGKDLSIKDREQIRKDLLKLHKAGSKEFVDAYKEAISKG